MFASSDRSLIGRDVRPNCAAVLSTRPPRLETPAGAPGRPMPRKSSSCVAWVYAYLNVARVVGVNV